jgi:glycosyltransferase involved in cell wall biosynthesis
MSAPLVSVIVATYGRSRFLVEALDSVLAQTVQDFECIVVDDASPEPIVTPDDGRIRLLRHDRNQGPSAARNTGLEAARGDYVVFLDDDDVLTRDRLAIGLEGVARAPIALCLTRYLHAQVFSPRILQGDQSVTLLEDFAPNIGQGMVPRSLAARFDERFRTGEDTEWWLRMSCAGSFVTVPKYGYLVRYHHAPRGVDDRERLRNRVALLELHADYFAERPRAAAVQWHRVGHQAILAREFPLARRALLRSLRLWPRIGPVRTLPRAFGPAHHVLAPLNGLRARRHMQTS